MFDKFNIYDCGDVNTNPFNIEKTTNMIIEQMKTISLRHLINFYFLEVIILYLIL